MSNRNKHFNDDQHDYLDNTFLKQKYHSNLHVEIDKKMIKLDNRVNMIYAIINKVALPISLTIVGAIVSMIFKMIQK